MKADPIHKAKVKTIQDINHILSYNNQPNLTPKDFDILWDLDIDELIEVMNNVARQFDSKLISTDHI